MYQGLPPKKELPVTNPESPAITLKRRRLHDDEEGDGNDETKKPRTEETGFQFKAKPVPDFSHSFKPQHEDSVPTQTEPFSFEERDKDKPTRESFVEMILRKSRVSHKCTVSHTDRHLTWELDCHFLEILSSVLTVITVYYYMLTVFTRCSPPHSRLRSSQTSVVVPQCQLRRRSSPLGPNPSTSSQ